MDDVPAPVDAGSPAASGDVEALLIVMAALRTPGSGCAWDLEQTPTSLVPYAIEEAYEVADAVARGDLDDVRDELGDLLLQVVFQARIAEEAGAFAFRDVVRAITDKLVRRHPHIFGAARSLSPAEVTAQWAEIKRAERAARPRPDRPASVLDDVTLVLPALTRAHKLTRKAAAVGFTWPDAGAVVDKIDEELAEVRDALASGSRDAMRDEIGDLLFTVANLARHLDIDPDAALAATNRKFERRFRHVEAALAALGRAPETSDLAEMDRLWDEAKRGEREAGA